MIKAALQKLARKPMLAVMAVAAILYGGTKGPRGTITFDELLVDQGSYLTNNLVHIAAAKTSQLLPDTAEMLVHARELGSIDPADWAELTPRRTVGDLPCDYTLADATNYNVTVTVDWQPESIVITNYLLTVPGLIAMEATPGLSLDAVLRGTAGVMYDSEIDYLESDGGQYIDTLYTPDSETTVQVEFMALGSSTDYAIFGSRTKWNSADQFAGWWHSSGTYLQYSTQGAITQGVATERGRRYVMQIGPDGGYIDGVKVKTFTAATFTSPHSMLLFAKWQAGDTTDRRLVGRIYSLKIWHGNTLVFDGIPVRVGDIGCLYDRVTPRLFVNRGTGSFVLGEDKP
jgi:hypothetical protein